MFIKRSKNSYMRSPRRVTMQPMDMPSRSLKAAMDFLALVTTGFWPEMAACFTQSDIDRDFLEFRNRHRVAVAELFLQRRHHGFEVMLTQARFAAALRSRSFGTL